MPTPSRYTPSGSAMADRRIEDVRSSWGSAVRFLEITMMLRTLGLDDRQRDLILEQVHTEVREANDRGYEQGFKDAKNEAAIAIEKLAPTGERSS